PFLAELALDLVDRCLHGRRVGRAHNGIVGGRDAADLPGRRHFAQTVDREDDVDVTLPAGAVEVDRNAADQQVAGRRVGGDEAALAGAERERRIAALHQGGGGQDGDAPLRQWRAGDEGDGFKGRTWQVQDHIAGRLWNVFGACHGGDVGTQVSV